MQKYSGILIEWWEEIQKKMSHYEKPSIENLGF